VEVHVDPVAGAVDAGGARWPLQLDPLSGSLTVQVAGHRVRLRSLRWREKLALARFAHLGERFLERELVRACLVDAAEPPQVGGAPEVLAALARWLSSPRPGAKEVAGLPFASTVLAAVTVEVCRAGRLRPADLDDLAAADVEELWRASGAAAEAAVPATVWPGGEADDPGLTRIVIVPDADAAAGGEPFPAAGEPSPAAAEAFPAAGAHDTGADSGDHLAGPEGPEPVAGTPRRAGPRPAAPLSRPLPPPASSAAGRRPAVIRFRPVEPVTATPPSSRPSGQHDPVRPAAEAGPSGLGAILTEGVTPAGNPAGTGAGHRAMARDPGPGPSDSSGAGRDSEATLGIGGGATARPRVAGGTRVAWPAGGSAEEAGRRLGTTEREALFEELSERLEQAAMEMGVDLEG
jgi:hypothetical protein